MTALAIIEQSFKKRANILKTCKMAARPVVLRFVPSCYKTFTYDITNTQHSVSIFRHPKRVKVKQE